MDFERRSLQRQIKKAPPRSVVELGISVSVEFYVLGGLLPWFFCFANTVFSGLKKTPFLDGYAICNHILEDSPEWNAST